MDMEIMGFARLLGLALAVASGAAAAQSSDTASAELFSRHAALYDARMSPSGDYLALAVPADGGRETRLEILKLDGSRQTQVLRFPQKQHVADITWASDDQLVLSRARSEPLQRAPVSFGELMTTDVRGKNQDLLFGYELDDVVRSGRRQDHGFASMAMVLDDDPGKILVEFSCWDCGDEPDTVVYKVDAVNGGRTEVAHSKGPGDFLFDRAGNPRIRITYDRDDGQIIAYRPTASADWTPLPASLGSIVHGAWFGAAPDIAYAQLSDHGEVPRLYRVDLAHGTRTELASHPDFAAGAVLRAGRNGEPFGAIYLDGRPAVRYFDPKSEWAQLHAGLMQAFKGELVRFVDVNRTGGRVLFFVFSDRHPGAYYLLDRATNKIQLIGETMPWIKPDAMAPSTPIAFTARDGRKLFGFYTAKDTTPRPLVVMPHGGPFEVSDTWGYDADAQFLASRGYGVLQVNYRGSAGRGAGFVREGWTHWGDLLIDDLVDGMRWVVDQKAADPARICTYGGSYGGYAAMMMAAAAPDLVRCAAGYAGVYDLPLLQKTSDTAENAATRRAMARTMGTDAATLRRFSPVTHAAELRIPLLLAHGRNDRRAPLDQYDAMLSALRTAGASPDTYVVTAEGHGFYMPEAQAGLYRRLDAFLSRTLNGNAAAGAAP